MNVETYKGAVDCLKALAHPTRLMIVSLLKEQERRVSDLVDLLQASQSNVSQHLSLLRYKGMVKDRRCGNEIYYSIGSEKLKSLVESLQELYCTTEN